MDPAAAAAAMEQMKKMSPEQMQDMMKMAQMNPDMMKQAMSQMGNMQADDWSRASEQMSRMSPADMQRQAAQANQHMAGQQQYVMNAAKQLKNEGNTLHNSKDYKAAAAKYEKARDNVKDDTSADASDLRRSCMLNLSSCYLNLKEFSKCIAECNLVIAGDAQNLKALYRRGQAYLGCQQWQAASTDLEKAVKLTANDPEQQQLIRDKLQEAKDHMGAMRANGVTIEDVTESEQPVQFRNTSMNVLGSSSSASLLGQPGTRDGTDMAAAAAKMMAENPDMARMAAEMMRSMPPEQLAAMTQQSGLPGGIKITPEMARAAADSISAMSAEDISRMAAAGGSAQAGLGAGGAPPGITPAMQSMAAEMMGKMSSEDVKRMQLLTATMGPMPSGPGGAMPQMTPEMASMASEMMSKMSPEDIRRMQEMASSMGMPGAPPMPSSSVAPGAVQGPVGQSLATASAPGMPALTPDMAKMAADMMSKMKPEDMERMTSMAASMGMGPSGMPGGGPPGMPAMTPEMAKMASQMMAGMKPEDMESMSKMAAGMGGGSGPPDMSSMMGNPKFMESALGMMKDMDQASLVQMMMSSGMCKSPQQAEAMAQQMKGMSDTQMKYMVKAANVVQGGAQAVKKTKEALMSRGALVVALVLVLIAVVLRYLGIM